MSEYIIDFAVDDQAVHIVELNAFSQTTGACLFDWKKDDKLIRSGPFELRVNQAPLKHLDALLMPWRSILNLAIQQLLAADKSRCLVM